MSLTCISCKVLFSVPDLQRDHYKTDWHRYNLKRKIAELPPITKDEFDAKVDSHNQTSSKEEEEVLSCELCHKKFTSKNTMVNHIKSKKHIEAEIKRQGQIISVSETKTFKPLNAKRQETKEKMEVVEDDNDSDWESCDDDEIEGEEDSIPVIECLFCSVQSDSIEDNVKHMTEIHSFFIPDIEYLTDLKGLLVFLGYKVGCGFMCLWCSKGKKSFKSVKAAQRHMLDKGHCKIFHEGEELLSYSDFYDYSKSYPDADKITGEDEEMILDQLQADNYELVLPSGATIGHRSLAVYYKQNLNPIKSENKALPGIMKHYKALGWTGTTGEAAVRKAKDLSYMKKLQNKYALRQGMKNNKLQHHFRPQVVF